MRCRQSTNTTSLRSRRAAPLPCATVNALALILGLATSGQILAQPSSPNRERNADTETETEHVAEEVFVSGARTLQALRNQIERAEERAFARFNELNLDDDYDIHCSRERPTGSVISLRVCEPAFVDRATRAEAVGFVNTLRGQAGTAAAPAAPAIALKMRTLERKIVELMDQDPAFSDAMMEYTGLRRDLDAALQQAAGAAD